MDAGKSPVKPGCLFALCGDVLSLLRQLLGRELAYFNSRELGPQIAYRLRVIARPCVVQALLQQDHGRMLA